MIDRLAGQAILLEPGARAAMQQHAASRLNHMLQAFAQKVSKQVMVAIPAPAAVQADGFQPALHLVA